MENYGLTNIEIVDIRLSILVAFIDVASIHNIEQDTIIKKAEIAWEYVVKPLTKGVKTDEPETTDNQP